MASASGLFKFALNLTLSAGSHQACTHATPNLHADGKDRCLSSPPGIHGLPLLHPFSDPGPWPHLVPCPHVEPTPSPKPEIPKCLAASQFMQLKLYGFSDSPYMHTYAHSPWTVSCMVFSFLACLFSSSPSILIPTARSKFSMLVKPLWILFFLLYTP